MPYELNFITDMVEEQIIKGHFRWLANFNEIHTDYAIGDITFPVYASGGLQERGFFLSRIFSAFVTPRYKIHLLLCAIPEVNPKFLRKIIITCKSKFGADDWIFLGLVQSKPFEKAVKDNIASIDDKNIGIAASSLASRESVFSNNVLGKGLAKQLKLTEAKFEALDVPNYVKSFAIVFCLGTLMLIALALGGVAQAISPLTLLILGALSLIVGHRIYKMRYHTTLTLNSKKFQLRQGQKITEGKWSDYTDVTIYITPKQETCIRLHTKKEAFDLPVSRVGISRREAYNAIRHLIKREQSVIQ